MLIQYTFTEKVETYTAGYDGNYDSVGYVEKDIPFDYDADVTETDLAIFLGWKLNDENKKIFKDFLNTFQDEIEENPDFVEYIKEMREDEAYEEFRSGF